MVLTVPGRSAHLGAAYLAARSHVPPLSRVVLKLHQLKDLPYPEIAHRLSINATVVPACIAEALIIISASLDGDSVCRIKRCNICTAEKTLLHRYSIHRGTHLDAPVTFEQWLWGLAA